MMVVYSIRFLERVREGEELKAPRYASAAATRDYITARDIIPNNNGNGSYFINLIDDI
jgi:hypothetical protein